MDNSLATSAAMAIVAMSNAATRIGEKSTGRVLVSPPAPVHVTDITTELLEGNVTLVNFNSSVLMKVKVGTIEFKTNQSAMTKPRIITTPKTTRAKLLVVIGLRG